MSRRRGKRNCHAETEDITDNGTEGLPVIDEKLCECLKDKASSSYQKELDFIEIIAFTNHFDSRFAVTPLSYAKLEQALEAELGNEQILQTRRDNNEKGLTNLVLPQLVRSPILIKLYKELLSAIGHRVETMPPEQFNSFIWRTLQNYSSPEAYCLPVSLTDFVATHASAKEEMEVCCWPLEMKLALAQTIIEALLTSSEAVSSSIPADDLRIPPFAIDKEWRKFWYYGDTYLYMEEPQCEDSVSTSNTPATRDKGKSKRKAVKTPAKVDREEDEANASLFTGAQLRVVCRTASDWERLANVYAERLELEVSEAMKAVADEVKEIELKVLKEEMLSSIVIRTSTRVQMKNEQRQREAELEEQRRKEQARLEREERRRMILYAADTKPLPLSSCEGNQLSREKRMRLREQRKAHEQVASEWKTGYPVESMHSGHMNGQSQLPSPEARQPLTALLHRHYRSPYQPISNGNLVFVVDADDAMDYVSYKMPIGNQTRYCVVKAQLSDIELDHCYI